MLRPDGEGSCGSPTCESVSSPLGTMKDKAQLRDLRIAVPQVNGSNRDHRLHIVKGLHKTSQP
jgi:hypothetical protein